MFAKRSKRLLVGFFVFWGLLILFNLVKHTLMQYFLSHYEPPPVTVSSVLVKEKKWQPYLNSVGNFVAIRGVDITSQVSGNVVKVHFDSGQSVKENAPLIDLDDAIEQSTLKSNQAELSLRKLNFKRLDVLIKHNATSSSSIDEAKAALEQADASVETVKTEILHKHITAPFAGQLGIRQVSLGQYVTAGQTHIVTLQALDPLHFNFFLPEQYDKQLYLNQPILLKLQGYPKLRFVSKIIAINPKSDTDTHNIEIQAQLPNCLTDALKQLPNKVHPSLDIEKPAGSLYTLVSCKPVPTTDTSPQQFAILPGMFASAAVTLPPLEHVLVVPTTAISFSLYGNAVYLLSPLKTHEKTKQGLALYQVKRVFVQTGDQEGNETVIVSGLKAGDLVVGAGELKLQNEMRVVINNEIQLKSESNFDQMGH
ncbi:MAG: efflux RND transporter periplasmic adaptor subunit [Gammaproteobacteria bacterium]|nr:efflux RND transporter periplasmic adaptor subunit [Gammaproteobacteria bacterium]